MGIKFIGKLRRLKENGYEEQEFEGGLVKKKVRFQMICGDSVQWLEASAFVWKDKKTGEIDASKNTIYTMQRVENGKDKKIEIKWEDRLSEEVINSVSGYKRWVIDTDTFANREKLEKEGMDEELEKSNKKRKEFIHASDFIDHLNKVLNSEKSKDMVFCVTGSVDFNYSPSKDMFYRTFTPQKITRVDDKTKQICEGSMKVYFSEGAVNDMMMDETGDIEFNAYTLYYDSNIKKNAFAPVSFTINKDAEMAEGFKMLFGDVEDEKVLELGVVVDFINGAPLVDITEDMLTDKQRKMIQMGMTSLEKIKKELGDKARGDKVTKTVLKDLMKGYSGGTEDTEYTIADLVRKPIKQEENAQTTKKPQNDDEDEI